MNYEQIIFSIAKKFILNWHYFNFIFISNNPSSTQFYSSYWYSYHECLFFRNIYLALSIILISMLITDAFIGFYTNIIFVYLSLFLITTIFYKFSKKINLKNLLIFSFVGSVIFFLISNFGVWAIGSHGLQNIPYEKNLIGLFECYLLAVPFFANTLISTIVFSYSAYLANCYYYKKFS